MGAVPLASSVAASTSSGSGATFTLASVGETGAPAGGVSAAAAGAGLSVAKVGGQSALVDSSLRDLGVQSATAPGFVDLSWRRAGGVSSYQVVRDGAVIGTVSRASSFRDTRVTPGRTYQYSIQPTADSTARAWSMQVAVPAEGASLASSADTRIAAASVAKQTTLTWLTFIPQAKIDAPKVGCKYGSGYQFGGDGHGYDWRTSKYRTALHALVTWSNGSVQSFTSIGTTHVYKKSNNKLVAQATATGKNTYAKRLGSDSKGVDIRMVTHATNPFCSGLGGVKGAIDGAIQIRLTKTNNWAIRSGNHRLMPNHHMYIYNGGRVTTIYTRNYSNALCLVGSATCPLANLTGFTGRFS